MSLFEQVEDLRSQLIREHAQAPGLFREMAAVESLLAETYRARVLYELLQNSDDAGSKTVQVDLSNPKRLIWRNDGRSFTGADVEALCRSAASTKRRGDTIGYRGIGFKSVAAVASTASVTSGGVCFRFDRSAAASAIGSVETDTPLLRVPASIDPRPVSNGAEFDIELRPGVVDQLGLDPIALLFLRNVEAVEVRRPSGVDLLMCRRDGATIRLSTGGQDARFHRESLGTVNVLVPLDAHAEALTGRGGRLCCFLPLDDTIGLPVIVSGDLTTDPSRTHAVVSDPSTGEVVGTAAGLIGQVLADPRNPANERLWDLLVEGEDLRTYAMTPNNLPGRFLAETKAAAGRHGWAFAHSEVPLDTADLPAVFPDGAPAALYKETNASQARALRTVFGLPTLRTDELVRKAHAKPLTEGTRARLATRLVEGARVEGRALTPQEQGIVGKAQPVSGSAAGKSGTELKAPSGSAETFGGAFAKWRAAEVAAMEHLNARGWSLADVSRQNVGYDLDGTSPDGTAVHIEVKKVDRRDARFALTNNETSAMLGSAGRYYLALVIGDGSAAQLALLDPLKDQIPRERVCRRWEWEYTDWARFAELID